MPLPTATAIKLSPSFLINAPLPRLGRASRELLIESDGAGGVSEEFATAVFSSTASKLADEKRIKMNNAQRCSNFKTPQSILNA
jgi:hypothetical protein